MLITPNPSVPVQVDNVTGQVVIQPNQEITQLGVMGQAVVIETQVSGNFYLVPAGKTFVGVAIIIAGAAAGTVEIQDASNTVLAASSGGGTVANPPVFAAINALSGEVGGGGGNQLKVTLVGGGQIISATIAGYTH